MEARMKSDEYKRLHHDMTQATFATEVMFGALITGLITSETLKGTSKNPCPQA